MSDNDPRAVSRREWAIIAVALAALVALTFWRRWQILDATPFPLGVDGYFYPIQLRALLERHELAYADFPLAFWLMTPFAAATDPIAGAKLASAVLGALIVLPAYGIGARLGRSPGAGLVAAALVATSAGATYLTIEFVKNGIGITIALVAIWLGLRAADAPTRGRLAAAIIAALAALATHKLAGAIVVLVATPMALAALSDRGVLHGRRLLYAIVAFVLASIAGLAILGGAGLAAGLFSPDAWVSAPALVRGDRVLLAMGHEPVIGVVLGWLALAAIASHRAPRLPRGTAAVAWTAIVLSVALAFPWLAVDDPQGLGFRLRVIAFVPMALCAAIVAATLARLAAGRLARVAPHLERGVPAAIALAIVLAMPAQRTEGRIAAHPAMVAAVNALAGEVPAGDVVIVPERHIMFMVAWYTRTPVRLRPDDVPRERRWRAMPLAFIGNGSPLDQLLLDARREPGIAPPIGLHPRHPNGFVLVREATWDWILARLPPALREHYARWPTI